MNLHIFSVGINYYLGEDFLQTPINDVNRWNDFFQSNSRYNVKSQKTLKEFHNTDKDSILRNFKEFICNIKTNELGVFIFSGHGTRAVLVQNNINIVTEYIRAKDKFISEKELYEIINQNNSNVNLISIIDACQSGGFNMFEKIYHSIKNYLFRLKSFLNVNSSNNFDKLNRNKFVFNEFLDSVDNFKIILSASEKGHDAIGVIDNINNIKNGLFTYCSLKVLENNSQISYSDFINQVTLEIEQTGYKQKPQIFSKNDNHVNKIIFT